MSWFAQVRHVMMKDLRQARWVVGLYAVVVIVATANAWPWSSNSVDLVDLSTQPDGFVSSGVSGIMLMPVVVLIAMLVVAAFVQADSPTRSDSFWASRPFFPSAVWAAKLALVLLLVAGLPLIGQAAALWELGADSGQFPNLLFVSFISLGTWLVAAMTIAALTRDLRTFAITSIFVPVVLIFLGGLFAVNVNWAPPEPVSMFLTLIGAVSGLALVTLLYKTRDTRRWTSVAGFLAAVSTLAFAVGPTAPANVPPASGVGPLLGVQLLDTEDVVQRSQLILRFHLESPAMNTRYGLRSAVATFHLRGGTRLQVPLTRQFVEIYGPDSSIADSVRWLNRSVDVASVSDIVLNLTDRQRAAIATGIASVTVVGSIEQQTLKTIGSLPIKERATLSRDGRHLLISRVDFLPKGILIDLQTSSIRPSDNVSSGTSSSSTDPRFALLNETSHEAVALSASSSTNTGFVVLPGVQQRDVRNELKMSQVVGPGRKPLVDDAWIHSSRLLLSEWESRGNYQVKAKFVVTPKS